MCGSVVREGSKRSRGGVVQKKVVVLEMSFAFSGGVVRGGKCAVSGVCRAVGVRFNGGGVSYITRKRILSFNTKRGGGSFSSV